MYMGIFNGFQPVLRILKSKCYVIYVEETIAIKQNKVDYYIMCGYQCDKAVTKNDTREVI